MRLRNIVTIIWQPYTTPWVKANTDGFVMGSYAACGDIFKDHTGAFFGGFSCNLKTFSVFDCELQGLMLTMELVVQHG